MEQREGRSSKHVEHVETSVRTGHQHWADADVCGDPSADSTGHHRSGSRRTYPLPSLRTTSHASAKHPARLVELLHDLRKRKKLPSLKAGRSLQRVCRLFKASRRKPSCRKPGHRTSATVAPSHHNRPSAAVCQRSVPSKHVVWDVTEGTLEKVGTTARSSSLALGSSDSKLACTRLNFDCPSYCRLVLMFIIRLASISICYRCCPGCYCLY